MEIKVQDILLDSKAKPMLLAHVGGRKDTVDIDIVNGTLAEEILKVANP